MKSNHFVIVNSKVIDIFKIFLRDSKHQVFSGSFEECVIWLIINCPDLRKDLKGIQFDKLKEILEGIKG